MYYSLLMALEAGWLIAALTEHILRVCPDVPGRILDVQHGADLVTGPQRVPRQAHVRPAVRLAHWLELQELSQTEDGPWTNQRRVLSEVT